ncbi:hypothetical protein [Endozoicomonas ascidiicola]|uniref:hypothetical protein n=1 Tax=Endozoicomonas ascidiicola TaxID=1698521 RepID=UPI0008361A9D|nr:hypothetical protein [Endozoicomonas ascidiicola]
MNLNTQTFGIFDCRHPDPRIRQCFGAMLQGVQKVSRSWLYATDGRYHTCDVAIIFGAMAQTHPDTRLRQHITEIHKEELGKPLIVMEVGFIKRGDYYSVGFNKHIGWGDYQNRNMPSDRWSQLQEKGVRMKPWRKRGDHILLCAQIPNDTSVQHSPVKDHARWCHETVAKIREHSDRPIVFRYHPYSIPGMADGQLPFPLPAGCKLSANKDILDDFKDCWAAVTFNSTSGVDALLAGIPVFAADSGSMVYPIADQDISRIETPEMPSRKQWVHDIAYAQWTLEEIKDGRPLSHLMRGFERYSTNK